MCIRDRAEAEAEPGCQRSSPAALLVLQPLTLPASAAPPPSLLRARLSLLCTGPAGRRLLLLRALSSLPASVSLGLRSCTSCHLGLTGSRPGALRPVTPSTSQPPPEEPPALAVSP
eukprot:3619801-Rhodomonas_salina.1